MASRKQIREAFYTDLESAASGLVKPDNIRQESPDASDSLPALVHNDDYREVPMNLRSSPSRVIKDRSGHVEAIVYTTVMQARFVVTAFSESENEKESIYESVRSYFEKYTHPIKDTSTLQKDVHRVEVGDASSNDLTNREPTVRGDALEINVHFTREYIEEVDSIEEVDIEVDADLDFESTDGDNYSITTQSNS